MDGKQFNEHERKLADESQKARTAAAVVIRERRGAVHVRGGESCA